MIFSALPFLLLLTPVLADNPFRYYLRAKPLSSSTSSLSTNPLYLSSSITINGHTNYVLLTAPHLAQPLSIYAGDGSITLDTTNVIGASSQAPILLSNNDGLNRVYKQVILGDQMAGRYTKGFRVDGDSNAVGLSKDGFGGFVACTAARGVKQVYWYGDGDGEVPVVCEEVEFERVWDVSGNGTANGNGTRV